MSYARIATGLRWQAAVLCTAALLLPALLCLPAPRAAAAARHCAPVVSKVGPGYTEAKVLILSGRTDCQKSRRVIYAALSTKRYTSRSIDGWRCESTTQGRSGVFGARCTTEGEVGTETIKSTVPQRCPGCHGIRK